MIQKAEVSHQSFQHEAPQMSLKLDWEVSPINSKFNDFSKCCITSHIHCLSPVCTSPCFSLNPHFPKSPGFRWFLQQIWGHPSFPVMELRACCSITNYGRRLWHYPGLRGPCTIEVDWRVLCSLTLVSMETIYHQQDCISTHNAHTSCTKVLDNVLQMHPWKLCDPTVWCHLLY